MLKLHIIEIATEKMLAKPTVPHCPRVGDEIRLSGPRYYKVDLVVWVFDEPENPHQRVNIGASKADASNTTSSTRKEE